MATLRSRFRERKRDEATANEYHQALEIVGDDPTSAQRMWLLAQVLGWEVDQLVDAIKREAGEAETKPLVDGLLTEAANKWPIDHSLPRTPQIHMYGTADTLEAVNRVFIAGKTFPVDDMNPADAGFRFVSLQGRKVATLVHDGEEPAVLMMVGRGISGSWYEPYLNFISSTKTIDPVFLESLGDKAPDYLRRAEELANRMKIVIDVPGVGHGDPYPVDEPRTWFDVADLHHGVLEKLGLRERPIVVGHSMGANFAYAYHSRYGAAGINLYDGSNFSAARGSKEGVFPSKRLYHFFHGYADLDNATIFDLRRGADQLTNAEYTQVPGISFRHDPALFAPTISEDLSTYMTWRQHGYDVASRLGMRVVETFNHFTHIGSPELTRYALAETVAAVAENERVVELDPAIVTSLGGQIPDITYEPLVDHPVTMADVAHYPDEFVIPPLQGTFSDRQTVLNQLALAVSGKPAPPVVKQSLNPDLAWPSGYLSAMPGALSRRITLTPRFRGSQSPARSEVFPRVSVSAVENLHSAISNDGYAAARADNSRNDIGAPPKSTIGPAPRKRSATNGTAANRVTKPVERPSRTWPRPSSRGGRHGRC